RIACEIVIGVQAEKFLKGRPRIVILTALHQIDGELILGFRCAVRENAGRSRLGRTLSRRGVSTVGTRPRIAAALLTRGGARRDSACTAGLQILKAHFHVSLEKLKLALCFCGPMVR